MVEVIMNSRSLASWFLIIGPIVTFAAFPFWPQVDTASEELTELVKNGQQSILGQQVSFTVFVDGLRFEFNSARTCDRDFR